MRFTLSKYVIVFALAFQSTLLCAQQSTAIQPRLVVGIMVDGMQQKHIELMHKYFDSNGIRKIIEKGTKCENVRYDIVSGGNASDIANVMTGTIPYYNGIAGNNYYNKTTKQIQSILYDDNELGIGTKLNVSAHNLLASTVLDELMLSNSKRCPFSRTLKGYEGLSMFQNFYRNFYLKLSFKASKASTPGQRRSSLRVFNGVLVV